MNILFTGVGRRVELIQAFRSAALVLDKPVKLYGSDMVDTAPALAYCDFIRKIVSMKDPKYVDNLLKICKEDKIDLVIPTIDTDLLVLSENKDIFEAFGTKVMISDPDKIEICRDKNYTFSFFMSCGLKAPTTMNNWENYEGGYPAFIKPKDGSSSIDAYKVETEEKLSLLAGQVKDYIVQPYICGREYTIDIFCDWEGNPLSIVPRERLQVRAGEVLKTQICLDEKMIKESKIICDAFKPCGPLTVQLIRDDEDEDWFIEINPRYGGGSPLSMKAGAKSAEAILKMLYGEKPKYYTSIEDGAVYSRFDQSVCVNYGKGKIKGIIFDLDDTLYSEKEYVKSGYKVVSDYLGGSYEEDLWNCFEDQKYSIDELLKQINREDEKQTVLEIYRSHMPHIHLYNGVKDLLLTVRSKGIKIGIITDGRPEGQRNKIRALGLDNMVDDIIITDELGGIQFRKPCDIAFRIMQTKWRMNPSEIIYVGDNLIKDFQAPQQLGMRRVLLRNKNGLYVDLNQNAASIETIDNLNDLKDILNS